MTVVKGGVWTNIEDEILKAAVSKYGLNQWARVSSLLARKTAKQCKARWHEWLDPNIRKVDWSRQEDEKLLHLAKLMPTQWRTIAPIVGRTATQCLERYGKLLDEQEAREKDFFSLGGPSGGETAAPSADDVRKLRPGEMDPDPESKPARPDTIDMDEDEKEMLSEARARLANTQGKKAKRKARERQLEESRRLAGLQKRRELKQSGINIKVTTVKKGQMDYNANIPFEKAPNPGFHDTAEEIRRNELQREAFDPKKQQLANKRKGDTEQDLEDRKRKKTDNKNPNQAAFAAAAKAGQMQKMREAERSSKRQALVLPSPQVTEAEMDAVVKAGLANERAAKLAGSSENTTTMGLVGNYTSIVGNTPIRTPRVQQEEDHIANEIRNARLRTETQSALLGGENTPLYEGSGSTGFAGATPSKQTVQTPNPMATPFRQGGVGATPMRGPGATPMRTPRDTLNLNQGNMTHIPGQTPREIRAHEKALRQNVQGKLFALPQPKTKQWDLELPEDQQEIQRVDDRPEDAGERDRRNEALRAAAELAEFKRQTQVVQRFLPRPTQVNLEQLLSQALRLSDPVERAVAHEQFLLIAHDHDKFGRGGVKASQKPLDTFSDERLDSARLEIAQEFAKSSMPDAETLEKEWYEINGNVLVPGLESYPAKGTDDHRYMVQHFENLKERMEATATRGNKIEKKLALHLGGYQQRAKMLREKIIQASEALEKSQDELHLARIKQAAEQATLPSRLEALRAEVSFISRREREAQDLYRRRRDELEELTNRVNGGAH